MNEAAEIYAELKNALSTKRTADAFQLTQLLHETAPESRESLTLRVYDFIERKQYIDALQCASSVEGEQFPELRAISLYFLKDPLWESIATSLEDDANYYVRKAMRLLLGKEITPQ